MKKRTLSRYFSRWLKANEHRFNNPLEIYKRKNGLICFKYKNIIPLIRVCCHYGEINVYADYPDRETYFDAILDLDFNLGKTKTGEYFCTICNSEGKGKLYPSINEILVKHQFNHFLKWSNENILESSFIGFFQKRCGSTWTQLIPKNKLLRNMKGDNECVVAVLSLKEYKEKM